MFDKCKRCGACCFLIRNGKQTKIPCKYLIFLEDGTTKCKVYYRNRIGRAIGLGNYCIKRTESPFDYPDCPYNTGKPLIENE